MSLYDYVTELDCSALREPYRGILSRLVVPKLVNWLGERDLQVRVSYDLAEAAHYSWLYRDDPLITRLPFIDPEYHPQATKADTLGLYLLHHGNLVARICSRIVWLEDSLADALEDMTLLYDRPQEMAMPGELVIARSHPAATIVKGCNIALMTAGHTAAHFRKSGAYDALQRLCRAKLIADYLWSYCVALIEPQSSTKLGFARYGHQLGAPGVWLIHGPTKKPYELYVSERPYLRKLICREEAADLSLPLLEPTENEINAALKKRRAE